MCKRLRVLVFGILALGLCLLSSPVLRSADDEDEIEKENIKEAKKASAGVKKLTDLFAEGKEKDIAKTRDDLNKTTDLKHIMWAAYKTRAKGGLGLGEKPDTVTPDGAEAKLINITRTRGNEISAAQLKLEKDNLLQIAHISQAIAEIAELNTPKKDEPMKKVADWKKYNQLQKDSAKELIEAVKANKGDKTLEAAKNLYSSCTNCHKDFRD